MEQVAVSHPDGKWHPIELSLGTRGGRARRKQSPVRAFHIGKTAREPYGVGFNHKETFIVKRARGVCGEWWRHRIRWLSESDSSCCS